MSQSSPSPGAPLALGFPPALIDAIADAVALRLNGQAPASSVSPYMTVDEAAAYLRCSRQRVYDLVHDGKLEPRRDGRRLLFHRVDTLDAYLRVAVRVAS